MITKVINDWCDKKFVEALDENDKVKSTTKAVVSGFVRGAVDASVVMYPIVLAGCLYWKHQALKK